LSNIVSEEKDFTFNVNQHSFTTSTFRAQFLSPVVSELIRSDPTVHDFEISRCGAEDCFHLFLLFANGEQLTVPASQTPLFLAVCSDLGNTEIVELIFPNEPASVENIGLRLQLRATDSDVEYGCEHFTSIDHSSFPADVLHLLLRDDRLRIESEDWLLTVIKTLIETDESYRILLETIESQYLSSSAIREYCELLTPDSVSRMGWESICRRLCLPVQPGNRNRRLKRPVGRNIPFDSGKPFDGIFHYLFGKTGRNPHRSGLISVSAPDEQTARGFNCEDLLSHESKAGKWWATNSNNVLHYVQIDLKDMKICPSAYSVKAHNSSCATGHFIQSWVFEGSDDGSSWESLDEHWNSNDLRRNDAVASHNISTTAVFRFLRFRMVGETTDSSWHFCLQQIEVFGVLIGETA
jgi:hypothetical protein